MDDIDTIGFKQNWLLDPKGYFLIRINKEAQTIEVGHCLENNQVKTKITGKTPEEIMYKIIDLNLLSLLDHAAYLGKELQKAHTALKHNFHYTQDSKLETPAPLLHLSQTPLHPQQTPPSNKPLIIRHRANTIKQLQETPEKYGVEIDIRANNNKLILNHEPHSGGEDLEEYLKSYKHSFIIFNIKEAGIENQIIQLAEKYNIKDYFLLDVEFPFIYNASRNKGFNKIAIRFSEAEPIEMALAQKDLVEWVWIDTNTQLPLNKENHQKLKQAGFKSCLVCPERWGRPEDIEKYIDYMKENNIQIDAVMTSLEYADKWETY